MKKEGYRRKTTFEKKNLVSSGFGLVARVMGRQGFAGLRRPVF